MNEVQDIVREEMEKRAETCTLMFVRKPSVAAVVTIVILILTAALGWSAFGLNHESRITRMEERQDNLERELNKKLDLILKTLTEE